MTLTIHYLLRSAQNSSRVIGTQQKIKSKNLLSFSTFMLFACGSSDDIELVAIGSDTKPPVTLESSSASKAKNIILLIGDGMGPNQVALARFATGGLIIDCRLKISHHWDCL